MSKKKSKQKQPPKNPQLKQVESLVLDGDYSGARKAIAELPEELSSDAVVVDALAKVGIEKTVVAVSAGTICIVLLVLFFTHNFHTH